MDRGDLEGDELEMKKEGKGQGCVGVWGPQTIGSHDELELGPHTHPVQS